MQALWALLWACAGAIDRVRGCYCGRVRALLRGRVVGLVAGACGHYYGRVRASTGAVMGICKALLRAYAGHYLRAVGQRVAYWNIINLI